MKRWGLALGLLLITGLAGWLLWNFDLSFLRRLSAWASALLCLLAVLFMVNYAFGIALLLRGMNQSVRTPRVYQVVTAASTASYLGNLQVSVPLRIYMLYGLLQVPLGIGTAAVGVETLLWLAMMGIIVAVPVPAFWGGLVWLPSALAAAGVACGVLALWYLPGLGRLVPGSIRGVSLARIKTFLSEVHDGLRLINPRYFALAALVFAFNYFLDALSLYIVLAELGYSVNLFHLLYAIVLSYLAGTLSMVPMGLGTRDISFVLLLTKLGVTPDVATAAALIQRVLRTVIPLLLGVISLHSIGMRRIIDASADARPRS